MRHPGTPAGTNASSFVGPDATQSIGSSTNTGIVRSVFFWYSA